MFDLKKRFIAVVRVGASATQGHERPQSRYVVICSERFTLPPALRWRLMVRTSVIDTALSVSVYKAAGSYVLTDAR